MPASVKGCLLLRLLLSAPFRPFEIPPAGAFELLAPSLDGFCDDGHVRLSFERDGIAAGACDLPVLVGLLPGVEQRDGWKFAESRVAARPVHRSPPDPVRRVRLPLAPFADSESQSVPVAVDARALDASDEGGRQSALVRGLDGGLRGNRIIVGHAVLSPIDSPNCKRIQVETAGNARSDCSA